MKNFLTTLAGDIASELKQRVQDGAQDAAMLLAATLLLVCGFVVFMYAGYLFLLHYMEPVYAALIIAALFVLAALLLLLAVQFGVAHAREAEDEERIPLDTSAVEAAAETYIRRNGKSAALMSLLAGVVVGSSPEVRRTLTHALDLMISEQQGRKEREEPRTRRPRR